MSVRAQRRPGRGRSPYSADSTPRLVPDERPSPLPGCRRVVVGLGLTAAEPAQAALGAAATMAERLRAELCGLFLEDANLHRLAALPCSIELRLPTGAGRPLSPGALETELRALAAGARQAVALAARRAQVEWTFHVRRSAAAPSDALAEAGADALLLLPGGRRLLQRVVARRAAPVSASAPVFALFEAIEGAERVLEVAACLAEAADDSAPPRPLRVLSLAPAPGAARRLQERAGGWLAARGLAADGLTLPGAGPAQVAAAVRSGGGGVIVAAAQSPRLGGADLGALLDELHGALLLVP